MILEITDKNIFLLENSFISIEDIRKELKLNPFAKIYVYIEENLIIGYLYFSEIYERVEINQIEVDFFHRNCGIGTKLMKFIIDSVDKNITLEVKVDNIYAIKLYEKFNFKRKAIRKGYYHGIDGILMEFER